MVNVVTIAAYRRIYWLRLIGLVQRSAATWRCVLHLSNEPGELFLTVAMHCYDDSTINCRGYYYYYYYQNETYSGCDRHCTV